MGAHPGGLYGSFTHADRTRRTWSTGWLRGMPPAVPTSDWMDFVRRWVLEPEGQQDYLEAPGRGTA